jgi:hypothetical protein
VARKLKHIILPHPRAWALVLPRIKEQRGSAQLINLMTAQRMKPIMAVDRSQEIVRKGNRKSSSPMHFSSNEIYSHACARCKSLKVRCEFKTDNDPCKRCLNGGHECVIPGRKKRRTPPWVYYYVFTDRLGLMCLSRKREHLIAEIAKQAETIDKLMAQLSAAEEAQKQRFVRSTSDSFSGTSSPPMLSPSSADANSSYFGDHSSPNPETNKAVEDWIVKARESLAVFGDIIGMGGASIPKSMIVEDDPEDSSSGDDDDFSLVGEPDNEYEIAVVDEYGDELSPNEIPRRASSHRGSSSSTGSRVAVIGGPNPKKKDSGDKLATQPTEAAPFGLMAKLSLAHRKRGVSVEVEDTNGDNNAEGLGVANANFFTASE